MTALSRDEILRYGRHLVMPEVSLDGQRRLKAARVLCIGAGGLGSPLGLYLAAAGVGTLGLVDDDRVELTNLQRQVLYSTADVGRSKVEAARERLAALNPDIEVIGHPVRLQAGKAVELVSGYDVVADGSDNFPTRYLVNDACVLAGKPNVYASIFRFEGQLSAFLPGRGPCYRCLFPEPPPAGLVPSCADGGVLGVLPGIAGSLQALEVLKLLLGIGATLSGRLLLFDALGTGFREVPVSRDPACPVCGDSPTILKPMDMAVACGIEAPADGETIGVAELKRQRAADPELTLLDVREPHEHEIVHLEGARLVPLRELPARLAELDPSRVTVVFCHHGPRSVQAVQLLRAAGFAKARSLEGGIDAWAVEADPSLARY